jgi:acyl-CoA hydrolase
VRFTGVWLPGVNRIDYADLHPTARAMGFFVAPEYRAGFEAGRFAYHPIPYSAIPGWYAARGLDVAFLHLSAPDAGGMCSVGTAADFTSVAAAAAKMKIGLVNTRMPRSRGPAIPYDSLDAVVEVDAPLHEVRAAAGNDAATVAIAQDVARWVKDGDTIEIGLGALPTVILQAIAARRKLRVFSGMISEPVAKLIDAGAIADDDAAIVAGVAFGDNAFAHRIAKEKRVRFASVTETHNPVTLAAIPDFVAINSVLSVDLLGQCNAEMLGPRQVSGSGGLTDFIRGAQSSPGGRAIVALPATAKDGKLTRIIPAHLGGSVISNPRADAPIVVTEYGSADLRALDIDARAAALTRIAAPQFREDLTDAWQEMRKAM